MEKYRQSTTEQNEKKRASSRLMNPFTLDFEDLGFKIEEEECKEVGLSFEDFGKNASGQL